MSGPYLYTPATFQPGPSLLYSPYAPRSPFIPSYLPPTSPYLGPTTPLMQPYVGPYQNVYWPPRPRRLSWHAGMPPSPYLSPPESPSLSRRRSFGSVWRNLTQFLPWAYPFQGPAPRFEIHPFLNGEVLYPDFHFDLAGPKFSPMRLIGPGQFMIISAEELSLPATNPPITRMRITHPAIPQWPIDVKLQYDEYQMAYMPPITLGDVLYMIHTSMRWQISHRDWAKLSDSEKDAVARAYTRRFKSYPSGATFEASQGVRRVDFLREKHIFKGLIRANDEDGFFHWKMIT
ncbi:hypothetical protein ID866_8805 [Astraeus odoratus]|nr:hypothetical protein ID866_8805 [Astraeus odoratus]